MRKTALCYVTNAACNEPFRLLVRLDLYLFLIAAYENLGTGLHLHVGISLFDLLYNYFHFSHFKINILFYRSNA
jgi:hypothetical protein